MLIDLSHKLDNQVISFPGDPPIQITQIADFERNGYSNYILNTGMHVGTHIDGLSHMTSSAEKIGNAQIECFYGEAILLNYNDVEIIDITENLRLLDLTDKIVLIYTNSDKLWGSQEYFINHPVLTLKLAKYLIKNKVKLIGIDFPSPDKAPYHIHKLLLKNGVYILENLTRLNHLANKKKIHLMAFPLNISSDSSPVRAIAQVE